MGLRDLGAIQPDKQRVCNHARIRLPIADVVMTGKHRPQLFDERRIPMVVKRFDAPTTDHDPSIVAARIVIRYRVHRLVNVANQMQREL